MIDDPAVEVTVEAPVGPVVRPMPIDTPLYQAAEKAARAMAPGVRVMPFMAAWTTDSKYPRQRGVITYGIDPPLSAEDGNRVHGKNERILLEALDWYTRYLRDIVIRVAVKPGWRSRPNYGADAAR